MVRAKRLNWGGLLALLFLLTGVGTAYASDQPIYTKDRPPRTPALDDLMLTDSVSEHGVTWTFEKKVPVGQFVNGDYYVVGPATVVSIAPAPVWGENARNGSVLNQPPNAGYSGFDSRSPGGRYDERMRAKLPIAMKPGDSLISTISVEKMRELPAPLRPSDRAMSPVLSASVLTCLDRPAPPDAFRPSYCDTSNRIYLARDLRRELLPRLPVIEPKPDPAPYEREAQPNLEEWTARYQRPWLDVCFFGFDAPIGYMPHYARELGRTSGIASLMLMLDYPPEQKERLLINFVQYGIDLWGIAGAGYGGWPAHGGHGSGRKLPIVFAGIMLGDEDMQRPKRKYPDLKFGEDMQTMYAEGWTGAKAVYAGHVGKDGEGEWGSYEHLHPSDWPGMLGENYRRCCTSIAWVGQALAIRMLHAEEIWGHDAFLDYVDRWMTEDDTEHIKVIKEAKGSDYSASWQRQGQTWDEFVNEMWAKHRNNLPPAPGE